MKDTKISTALTRLCNLSRCYAVGAVNYETVLGIKSTADKESLLEQLSTANVVLGKIEKLCSVTYLAMLKFRYGFSDHFGDKDSLRSLAEYAYSKNSEIGECIVLSWRAGNRAGPTVSAYGFSERKAQRLVQTGKEELDKLLLNFHSDLDLSIVSLLNIYY